MKLIHKQAARAASMLPVIVGIVIVVSIAALVWEWRSSHPATSQPGEHHHTRRAK